MTLLYLIILLPFIGCNNAGEDQQKQAVYQNPMDSINSVIKSTPNEPDLYFERSKMHYANRDLASAMSDVGRALKLDSSQAEYYLFLANMKLLNKESRDARDLLLKAHDRDPENLEVLLKLGELYMVVEDFETSFQYLNEALRIDLYNATAYRLKGFNYKYAGDTAKAVSSFQTAIEQDPNDYDSYMQLGLLFTIPLDPLALQYFDNAIRVNPQSLEAHYAKGMHLQRLGESRQALNVYKKILEFNPRYYNASYNQGYIYLEQISKYDSAAYHFTEAIQNGPERYFTAMYNRGLAQERLGNLQKARADYEQALLWNPQYDLAAIALERIGK